MVGFIYSCNSCEGSAPDWWVWEPILISVCVTHEMNVGTSRASGSDRRVAALSPISHSFLPLLILLSPSLSLSVTFRGEDWALSCGARLVHLYQLSVSLGKSVLGKRVGGGVYLEHLCPSSSPPCTHCHWLQANVCRECVYAHRNTQRDVQSQMLPIWVSHADALSPALSSHCKQSKQTQPNSLHLCL